MKRLVLTGLVGFVLVVTVSIVSYSALHTQTAAAADPAASEAASAAEPATAGGDALVERGRYLVTFGGCNDCHSPKVMTAEGPVPDTKRLLSGHPAGTALPTFDPDSIKPGGWVLFTDDLTACVGPFGVICSANLTPDDATGTGLWKEENFVNAMRTGKHMGMGRPIMPPMPWQNVKTLTDDDLKAVFAYLHSLPPIKNQVPGAMTLQDFKSE